MGTQNKFSPREAPANKPSRAIRGKKGRTSQTSSCLTPRQPEPSTPLPSPEANITSIETNIKLTSRPLPFSTPWAPLSSSSTEENGTLATAPSTTLSNPLKSSNDISKTTHPLLSLEQSEPVLSEYFCEKLRLNNINSPGRVKNLAQAARGFWEATKLDQAAFRQLYHPANANTRINTRCLDIICLAHNIEQRVESLGNPKLSSGKGRLTIAIDEIAKALHLEREKVKKGYDGSKNYMKLLQEARPGLLLLLGSHTTTVWEERLRDEDVDILLGYLSEHPTILSRVTREHDVLVIRLIIRRIVSTGWTSQQLAGIRNVLIDRLEEYVNFDQETRKMEEIFKMEEETFKMEDGFAVTATYQSSSNTPLGQLASDGIQRKRYCDQSGDVGCSVKRTCHTSTELEEVEEVQTPAGPGLMQLVEVAGEDLQRIGSTHELEIEYLQWTSESPEITAFLQPFPKQDILTWWPQQTFEMSQETNPDITTFLQPFPGQGLSNTLAWPQQAFEAPQGTGPEITTFLQPFPGQAHSDALPLPQSLPSQQQAFEVPQDPGKFMCM